MNTTYKSIWNSSLGAWVAVSELALGRGKRASSSIALSSVLLALPLVAGAQTVTPSGDYTSTNPLTASPWDAGNQLNVGNAAAGSLSILGGGTVTGGAAAFGTAAGVHGTLLLDGVGSNLTFTGGVTTGSNGVGTSTITNGATLSGGTVTVGTGTGTGTLTVSGIGSKVTQTSPTPITGIGVGGGNATAGSGTGTLVVSNGGTVSAQRTQVGFSGGSGTVTIDGAGSTWTTVTRTNIGNGFVAASAGTLNILNGGSMTSGGYAAVGASMGGTGIATVSGAGSTWTVGSSNGVTGLVLGYGLSLIRNPGTNADGTLTIANGGTVNAPNVSIGGYAAVPGTTKAVGTLNIGAAAGSAAVAAGTLNAATVAFDIGTGTLNFNHTSTDGSYVFAPAMSSSTGAATLNQIAGNTTLTGDSSGFGGAINVAGGTLGVTGKLGNTSSTATVDGGLLAVSSGGVLTGSSMVIGNAVGSNGTVTVRGPNSSVTENANLIVGNSGSGTLAISNGGVFNYTAGNSTGLAVGKLTGSTGAISVDGIGSTFTSTAGFTAIGSGSSGSLSVSGGASAALNNIAIGNSAGTGIVTVTCAGSTLIVTNGSINLGQGLNSSGTLNVLNGGVVTQSTPTGRLSVGGSTRGPGAVTVSGAGSVLTVNGLSLFDGYSSQGSVTIADQGVVNVRVVQLGTYGTLNIGAAAGSLAVAPGSLNSSYINFYGATSTLNFNHTSTDGSYVFASVVGAPGGSGIVNQLAGNTNLTGNSNAFGGTTNITGGTLRVNGTLGTAASTVNVSNGGTLGGSGTVGGSAAIGNGTLAPGNSPGTLTIAGNLALSSGSQLNYELGAANTAGGPLNDLTNVGGNLTLAGTLNVTQSAGGTYGAGIYRLFNYAGTLTNNGLALGNMPAGTDNSVQTSVAQQVNLVNSKGLTLNFWDGDAGVRNDGVIAGGNGTWVAATPGGTDNWTQADGLINAPYQNPSFAIFEGAPGTVTVDNSFGPVAVSGMQFATSGYRIQGGDIALTAGTNAIRVGDGTAAGAATTATIASNLVGAGRLDKVDAGTLVLAGNNTYTGGTQVSGGTLQLGNGGTTGTIVGDVTNNATLAFNRSDANTFAGTISGSGAVTQIGSGNTTLAAVNTYSGGTIVSAGTLTGSASSFGSGTISDNATLVINQLGSATMANAINGTGTLIKSGAGAVNYIGTGTLSGATTVAQGTLAVNGSLANSALTVANGATLGGTGTVGATTLQSGATIAPGNSLIGTTSSIGTLTANGNYLQATGSTYQVKVDSSTLGTSDRINVVGAASLAGGALLNVARPSASPYALNSQYTVLNATGGVTGKFTLTGNTRTAFVQIGDTYDANNVYLTAAQVRSFTAAGVTLNQNAVARSLDALGTSSVLRNAVAFLPNDVTARAAFDQLSGEQYASVQTALVDDSRFVRSAANDRLLGAFCAPGASTLTTQDATNPTAKHDASGACAPAKDTQVWASVFGATGRLDSGGNAQTLKHDTNGFFVGADTSVAGGWRVGGLGGWSHGAMNAASGSTSTDDHHLGVYAGNEWDGTSLRLGASYTWHTLNTQRNVFFPGISNNLSSERDGTTAQVFGEVGHRFELTNALAVEPFAGLAHVSVKTDAFAERGGIAALTGSAASMDSTFSTLGARFSAKLSDQTALRGLLGWRHAFGNATPTNTNAFQGSIPFTVQGVPLAKNVAVVEAGIETELTRDLKLSVSYSGQFANKLHDNGAKVALNYRF